MMLSKDIVKKIRHIEISTKRMLSGSLVGDYTVAQKGFGLEFDQIREYQPGDDVRFIDWKSSARMNKLLIKQYLQDRNRTVLLVVDVSGSSFYGSKQQLKFDLMAEVASVLALVADYGKDRVGLVLFSDEVQCYMKPKKGRAHVHAIMQTLFKQKSTDKKTNIAAVLKHLSHNVKKDTIVFFISDFIDPDFDENIKKFSKFHEIVAIRCLDKLEKELPPIGFLQFQDIESGQLYDINVSQFNKNKVESFLRQRLKKQCDYFKKVGIDSIDFYAGRSFMGELIRFFRRRMLY